MGFALVQEVVIREDAGMLATVASGIEELAHAVDGLAAESLDGVSAHAIGDDLVAIRRQIDRLDAEFIRRTYRFAFSTALDARSAPSGPGDERRGSQRGADALAELASRQLKAGSLPATHGQRPHLVLTATRRL